MNLTINGTVVSAGSVLHCIVCTEPALKLEGILNVSTFYIVQEMTTAHALQL